MSLDRPFGNCSRCGENESMNDSDMCKGCSMCVTCGKFPSLDFTDICYSCNMKKFYQEQIEYHKATLHYYISEIRIARKLLDCEFVEIKNG